MRLVPHKSHAIRVTELSVSPQKRCNPNDAMSHLDTRVRELHATFPRNHYERPHTTNPPARNNPAPTSTRNPDGYHSDVFLLIMSQWRPICVATRGMAARTPTRCATRQQPPWCTRAHPPPHNPDSRQNRHKHGGATPDQGRYTRSEKVHCLRIGRTAPTHKNKRGADRTSPLPTTTSPSIGHQADLLSPIDAAPPRASSWACAQVVDGLFMRLLSRPLGVFRFR